MEDLMFIASFERINACSLQAMRSLKESERGGKNARERKRKDEAEMRSSDVKHADEETFVGLFGLSDGEFDGEEFPSGCAGLKNTFLSDDLRFRDQKPKYQKIEKRRGEKGEEKGGKGRKRGPWQHRSRGSCGDIDRGAGREGRA